MKRPVALLAALACAAVPAAPAHGATTAWSGNQFQVDTFNLVRRSNIVLGRAPTLAKQSMDLGNGSFGVAAWAANGFTAQLNRADTLPNHRSAGQLVIPGLAAMTSAADYTATVDLYDATYRQSGGGMTATTYVRADKDELVVDVTGADPASAQTATIDLQAGRKATPAPTRPARHRGRHRLDRHPGRDLGRRRDLHRTEQERRRRLGQDLRLAGGVDRRRAQ